MEDRGLRYNEGKTRHDLVPAFAQEQYAKVLTKGAEKYSQRNWERGMRWSKVIASLKRHLNAFELGEDFDPETGLYHTAQIMCNAAFLTEYYKIYPQGDDRPHKYLNKVKIGLDIDDVLANWSEAWTIYWNMPMPTSWHFDRNINDKFEEMKSKNDLDKFYMNLTPLISPENIPFEPHCYITSRPVDLNITQAWLDVNQFPHRPIICVGLNQSKVEAVKQSGCDIFVDDRFDNFVEINSAGICCYLFDAKHNSRYNVGYKRIYSLTNLI